MPDKSLILVVDDEAKIRDILRDILSHARYDVLLAKDGEQALSLVESNPVDLVLLDLVMPGMDGMTVLKRMGTLNPLLPVLIISAHGNIPKAVEATRLGAVDFIEKPINMQHLLTRIQQQLEKGESLQQSARKIDEDFSRYGMIGISSPMKTVFKKIDQVAPTNARVLITGNTGTGKELVAKAIHRLSRRAGKPFIQFNCAAIPHELIESELFGYRKGAFTGAFTDRSGKFQAAHQGTLLLDEIGDMSLMAQAKVLRVLEQGEIQQIGADNVARVDVRVIAATNKNLEDEIAAGRFREDLFYRLNVTNIELPELKERKMDIPHLVQYFLKISCEEHNKRHKYLTARAMEALINQEWQGNVRELRYLIERLVIYVEDDGIDLIHVKNHFGRQKIEQTFQMDLPLKEARDQFEKDYIEVKLIVNDWSIGETAKQLGIERTNLYRKMKALGISLMRL